MSYCCARADAEVAAAQKCCHQNVRTPGLAPPAASPLRSGCLKPAKSPAQGRASWRGRLPQQVPRSTLGAAKPLHPAARMPRRLDTPNALFAARLRPRGARGRSMAPKPLAVSRRSSLHRIDRNAVWIAADMIASTEVNCLQGRLVAPQACTVASSFRGTRAHLDMHCNAGHGWVTRAPAQRPRTRGLPLPMGLWPLMFRLQSLHAI